MKSKFLCLIVAMVLVLSFRAFAEDGPKAKTLVEAYPLLPTDGLVFSKLVKLPEGVIARCGDKLVVTPNDLQASLNGMPGFLKPQMADNMFFLLELHVTTALLNREALEAMQAAGAPIDGKKIEEIVGMYLNSVAAKMNIQVKDEEIEKLIKVQKVPAEQVEKAREFFKNGLLKQKYGLAFKQIRQELGKRMVIEVSEDWIKEYVANAKETVVDKMRKSSKPGMVVFFSHMRRNAEVREQLEIIVQKLAKEYEGKVESIILDFAPNTVMAMRFGLQFGMPAGFIFFDKTGKETARLFGAITEEELKEEYEKALK